MFSFSLITEWDVLCKNETSKTAVRKYPSVSSTYTQKELDARDKINTRNLNFKNGPFVGSFPNKLGLFFTSLGPEESTVGEMLQTNRGHFKTLCTVQYDPTRCKRQWIVPEDTTFISWSTTMDSNQTGSGAHPANGRLHLTARLRGQAVTPDITRAPSWPGI
jgi:hypothetical protein